MRTFGSVARTGRTITESSSGLSSFLPLAREFKVQRLDRNGRMRQASRQKRTGPSMDWIEASRALREIIILPIEVEMKKAPVD